MVLLAAVVIAYALFLARYISPHASGSDSSGYLNSARMLDHGIFLAPVRVLPGHTVTEFGGLALQPLGFYIEPDGNRMAPTYPIGLPLHLLVAAKIAGWHNAVIAVNLLTALASGGLLWALARYLGLPSFWAGTGVVLLWLCPLFLFCAVAPMSDLLALGWSLATLYGAVRVREHWRWALASGAALGLAVLVRPTNILLAVPVLVALGLRWRLYPVVALGALPGIAAFATYNWLISGSPLRTGYGDVSYLFSRAYLAHNLAHIVHWVPLLLTPLIIFTLAAPFLKAVRQRGYAVLAVWFVTLTGFYAFYYHTGETWWYLRFILPAFPALIMGALAGLAAATQSLRLRTGPAAAVGAALVVFAAGWDFRQTRQLNLLAYKAEQQTDPDVAQWTRKNLPADAAIFCMQVSGAFYYYTNFLLIRWDMVDQDRLPRLFAALGREKRPVYAVLYEFERQRALDRMGGQWRELATVGNATVWKLLPAPRP
jgi:hypothetical protein